MSNREDQLQMFQVVTGATEAKARFYLQQSNWNTELAISNWFERGEVADTTNPLSLPEYQPPPVFAPPPPVEYVGTLPGLYNKTDDSLIPLKAIDVKVKIIDFIADVEVTQRFVNEKDVWLEAVFKFEHHEAAMTNMEVEIDGKILKGICKDKKDALNDFDDAIASGHGAYMLEKGKKENFFKVSVGNLPPQKECRLTFRYVTELEAEDEYLKFILPITRIPLDVIQKPNIDSKSISGMSLNIQLVMLSNITEIKCNSHQINTNIDGINGAVVLKQNHSSGVEFEMFIKVETPHTPVSVVEVFSDNKKEKSEKKDQEPLTNDMSTQTASISLSDFGPQPGSFFTLDDFPQPRGAGFIGFDDPLPPTITTTTITADQSADEKAKTKHSEIPHAIMITLFPKIETDEDTISEVIFLVDRSGSMAGSRMNQAKNALQLFLRSLPQGTKFNIIGFGSTFQKLFPTSQVFNDNTLRTATQHIATMDSNLGGTKILEPLRDILSSPVSPHYPRQVFCITDGEVDNTQEVLNYVKNSVGSSRIFTFGIGAEASKTLVRGIAKYGRGKEEFVVSGERMESKVMKQLKRALMPILKNVSVNWGDLPLQQKYSDIELKYPPVFDGERLIVYNFIRGSEIYGTRNITITGNTGEESHKWEVPINFNEDVFEGSLVHRLTARYYVKSLEETNAKANRDKIVQLGKDWGLVTKYTSYIAVEERDYTADAITKLEKVDIKKKLQKEEEKKSYDDSNMMSLPMVVDNIEKEEKAVIHSLDRLSTRYSPISPLKTLAQAKKSSSSRKFSPIASTISSLFSTNQKSMKTLSINSESSSDECDDLLDMCAEGDAINYDGKDKKKEKVVLRKRHGQRDTVLPPSGSVSPPTSLLHQGENYTSLSTIQSQCAPPPPTNITHLSLQAFSRSPTTNAESGNLGGLVVPRTSPVVAKTSQTRPFDVFILQQNANGSFVLNDEFLTASGLNTTKQNLLELVPAILKDAKVEQHNIELIWATAIALVILEVKFSDLRVEWELLSDKSRKFISRALKQSNIDLSTLLTTTKTIMKL